MKIGIMDADFLYRSNQRFPNLACEKISGYHKENGDDVSLITDANQISRYEKVYISQVFTDTVIPNLTPENASGLYPNVEISWGGTGLFFDKAPNLPYEIEHHMPDYDLYKGVADGADYTETSIGYLTRGCFRKCGFCVNQKYNRVFRASELEEFFDPSRKRITMLDDNFLGWKDWRSDLDKLIETGKPFCFKQGLDERLLTDEKCETLFNCKYYGDYTFAFDNVEDAELIESKLKMIRKYYDGEHVRFYVLVGFKSTDAVDIENALYRVELLRKYRCLPYIMRYQSSTDKPYLHSEWKPLYVLLARWCNQPSFFKKTSLYEFAIKTAEQNLSGKSQYLETLNRFMREYPEIAIRYFHTQFGK